MSQRQQLERIIEIDRQIRAGLYPNAARLAERLEVSMRAVYTDKRFMVDRLHAPIEFDRERGGWYYTDHAWSLPTTFATEGELLAFFLSVDVARRYLGTAFEAPLRSAIAKLADSLGDRIQVSLEQLRQSFTFAAPEAPAVAPELLADLQRAIQQQLPMAVHYYTASRDAWTERIIHPYHLYNTSGDWYVFAYDLRRQEVRNFHVGRIDRWSLQAGRFERAPDFSPRQHMQAAFQAERGGDLHSVVIRFGPEPARYIRERRWHASQEPLEELADGGVVLRMTVSGLGEVKRWVMQYGPGAEVLAPASLRRSVAESLHSAAAQYEPPG